MKKITVLCKSCGRPRHLVYNDKDPRDQRNVANLLKNGTECDSCFENGAFRRTGKRMIAGII